MKKIISLVALFFILMGQIYAQSVYDTFTPIEKSRFKKYVKDYLVNFTGLNSDDIKIFGDDYYDDYFRNDAMIFILAVRNNEIKIIKNMLAQNKKYINLKTFDNTSALNMAVISGAYSSAEVLLENGANVNKADEGIYTPLILAAADGNVKMAKLLISKGAKVNFKSEENQTALDRAIVNNGSNSAIVQY